jgi:hypothetical protein
VRFTLLSLGHASPIGAVGHLTHTYNAASQFRALMAIVPQTAVRTKREQATAVTRGEHLAFAISHALTGAATIVRGMWRTLTDAERSAMARRTVDRLSECGDPWRLDEEMESPSVEAHTTPRSLMEAHDYNKLKE